MKRSALVALMYARVASAYSVTATASGAPVHWEPGTVAFSPDLLPSPPSVQQDVARGVVEHALATWQATLPDTVTLAVGAPRVAMPHVNDGVPSIRWIVDPADPDLEPGLLARTFLAYGTQTGALVDADVVIDAVDYAWTTDPTSCTDRYDFESALTHELGHALGLAHSADHPEATMFATGQPCEIVKRDLADDDLAGVASLYPPPPPVATEPAPSFGCDAASGEGGPGFVLVVLAALCMRRRRRVAAACVFVAGTAPAATLRRMEVSELAARAVLVVRGHVETTAVTPQLETDAVVRVDACLAGRCPERVVVRRHGGERDGEGLVVDGEAALAPGDVVVLYLRVDRGGHARVLGGVQGAWRIDRADPHLATRDLRGHRVLVDGAWRAGTVETIRVR